MVNEEISLIKVYEGLDPHALAELFRKAPEQTRKGLEFLINRFPNVALNVVPNAFDQQTGLYAKSYFEESVLPERLREASANNVLISYVLIDVDNLKDINKKYGHQGGDKVIKSLVDLLNSNLRLYERRAKPSMPVQENRMSPERRKFVGKPDSIGRMYEYEASSGRVGYGDEFGVLLYGCDSQNAKQVMEKFLENVRNVRIEHRKKQFSMTISAGIAEYVADLTQRELIARADRALYQAKSLGRNKVQVYNQNLG